jgi:hypothetical protein
MIYITGDTHSDFGRFSSKKWTTGRTLTKDDYVIICGDFGGLWNHPGHMKYDSQEHELNWLNDKPWTTLWVDGNHENFNLIKDYPLVEKFGAPVHQIKSSIFHLRRGYIYLIDNKKFFTFGGAESIDKNMRRTDVSWWAEELPSIEEEQRGLDNLEKHQFEVDYVITHTAPRTVVSMLGYHSAPMYLIDYSQIKFLDPTTKYLEHIAQTISFKHWYFGHFHEFKKLGKYTAIYEQIIKLEE